MIRNTWNLLRGAAAVAALSLLAPAGAHATTYLGDSVGTLWTVDPTSGAHVAVGNMGQTMTDIAQNANGDLYAISFSQLFGINSANGQATLIGNLGNGSANAAGFSSDGTLYTWGLDGNVMTIDLATGLGTTVGTTSLVSSGDIAWDAGTGTFFGTASGATDSLVRITTTGQMSTIGVIGFSAVYGLDYSDGTNLYAFTASGQTLLLNQTTGLGAVLNNNGVATYGATGTEASVPEPASLALLGLGAAAMVRRTKRA